MWIRKRISQTKRQTPSYQLLESYRDDGKTKHRVICNLGKWPTIEDAIKGEAEQLAVLEQLFTGELPAQIRADQEAKIEKLKEVQRSVRKAATFLDL